MRTLDTNFKSKCLSINKVVVDAFGNEIHNMIISTCKYTDENDIYFVVHEDKTDKGTVYKNLKSLFLIYTFSICDMINIIEFAKENATYKVSDFITKKTSLCCYHWIY